MMDIVSQHLIDRRAGGRSMARHSVTWIPGALLAGMLLLLLAGCGGAPASSPPAPTGRTPAVVPVAVAATDAPASDAPAAAPAVEATEPLAPPTLAPAADAGPAGASPTPGAAAAGPTCTVVANALRLRNGPGEVYNPPIATLAAGTALRPLAYTATGYPTGQWIAVQTLPAGQIGWVNAATTYVTCTVELASLPPGSAPPTPAPPPAPAAPSQPQPAAPATPTRKPAPSPTPPRLAAKPPDGEVQIDIIDPQDGDTITDQLTFQAEAVRVGLPKNDDGTGIDRVDMSILDAKGQTVYKRTENNARYCAFGGGEPNCTIWVFAAHGNKWPNGKAIQPGAYTLRAVGYSIYPNYDKPKRVEIQVQINPTP